VTKQRALVYDPYLSTLGGGERYAYSVAAVLAERIEISIAGRSLPSPSRLERLGFTSEFELIRMDDQLFSEKSRDFDLAVVVANRLPPRSRATESILIVQFPFPGSWLRTPWRSLRRRNILDGYKTIVYSEFVRDWCERRWRIRPSVVSPHVALATGELGPKTPMILSVGRFFTGEHSKRHDILIDAFRTMWSPTQPEWELVLAGGIAEDSRSLAHLEDLKSRAQGLPVRFEINAPRDQLEDLYRQASLFWHAAGFGRSARKPERAEHFGITTLEAMSHRAVPLVFDDGGQTEIVTDSCGIRWRSVERLIEESSALLGDRPRLEAMGAAARERSMHFSFERFASEISRVVGSGSSEPGTQTVPGFVRTPSDKSQAASARE
jgi:glycosyltransferase involved in cell wall biosynthesis